jgi:hypothetical protein
MKAASYVFCERDRQTDRQTEMREDSERKREIKERQRKTEIEDVEKCS